MSVRISHIVGGHGVKLEIDGFNVPELADVTVRCPVDGLVTITADVLATRPFEIDLEDSKVQVFFHNALLAHEVRKLIGLLEDCYGYEKARQMPELRAVKACLDTFDQSR